LKGLSFDDIFWGKFSISLTSNLTQGPVVFDACVKQLHSKNLANLPCYDAEIGLIP
jgi:hypothetical protein